MKEILDKKDIKWRGMDYYVLREDKLYKINKSDLIDDETYCITIQSPTTPPNFGLSLRKHNKELTYDNPIREVYNYNYLQSEIIKSYILGIDLDKFKNYWEEK
jgi:hypothetical protein